MLDCKPLLLLTTLFVFLPSCKAQFGSGSDIMDLMIIDGSLSTNVTYGDNVTLLCVVMSSSPSVNISWNTTTGNTLPEPMTVRESDGSTYNSSLTLTNVNLTYTGLYSCVAIDDQSDKDVFPISLTVQVPPPNVTVTPRSVEEYYNQSVSLECQIDSLTKPMVNWSTTAKVDLDQIQKDVTMTTGYMYVSTLVLSQITLDHIGEYTCSAQNEGGSDSDTASVNVLVPLPEVTVSPDNLSVRYNSSFTLECRVTSFTETNITWSSTSSISKLPEPSLKVSEGGVVYTSTLQLDRVTLEHSGNYTCTAINTNGIEISDVAAVQVYIPPPNVTVTPQSVEEYYNQSVSLKCQVDSLTEPTVNWSTTAKVDLDQIQENVVTMTTGSVSTLVLNQITLDHTGEYTCSAQNEGGSDSDTASLSVLVPPPEVTVTPSPATGVFNQSVTLRCQIVSFTQTPNITWSTTANIKNLIQPLLVNGSEKGVFTSSLFLSNLTLESEGDYTCTAENGAGRGNDTSTLTVTAPIPVVTIAANDNNSDAVHVAYNSSLSITCTVMSFVDVEIQISGPGIASSSGNYSGSSNYMYTRTVVIDPVTLDTSGTYTCRAVDERNGVGTDSIIVNVFVPPPVITPIRDVNATIGHNVTLECNAVGFNLTYNWTIPFFNCPDSNPKCILGEKEPVLTILDGPVHSGTYTCTVMDFVGQKASESATVIVKGIELINATRGPLTRTENDTFNFHCEFQHPLDILEPVTVRWNLEGRPVTESKILKVNTTMNNEIGIIMTNLIFDPLDRHYDIDDVMDPSRRVYTCEAFIGNRFGESARSEGIRLSTLFTPFFDTETQTHPQNPLRINLGNRTKISCFGIGNPTSLTSVEDVTNGTPRVLKEQSEPNNALFDYIIDISEVSKLQYRCVANNSLGTRVYDFTVIIQDVPRAVNESTITVTTLSFTSVRVSWTPPFDSFNNITHYYLNYSVIEDGRAITNTEIRAEQTYEEINNLAVNTNYFVIIRASNGVGEGDYSLEVPFVTATSRGVSLVDVTAPRVLVTSSSIFIQWSYPELIERLIRSGNPNLVISVVIRYRASGQSESEPVIVNYPTTSTNVTGLSPGTTHDFTINVQYDGLDGIEIMIVVSTRREDNLPEDKAIIDTDRLRGENPSLDLSWTPLDEDNGATFLTNYLVRITITGLPQASRSRRQIDTETIDRIVDKSESSYSYDQIEPFTRYSAQVFAQLLINGMSSLAAVTAPITADSNETAPTAPRNIVSNATFTSITLSWDIPDPPNGFVFQYKVYRRNQNSGESFSISENGRLHMSTNLVGDTTYNFNVTGRTSAGEGPPASITVTTPAGIYPPGTPQARAGSGNTIIVTIPELSSTYGPLSHYLVVVVTGDSVISDSNLLYGYNDNEWRDFGYYVAAIFPANRSNTNFTLGDKTSSTLNGVAYYNGPLEEDTAYRVFIKVYSAADNPVETSKDSSTTVIIRIPSPSTFDPLVVVLPVVFFLLILIIMVVVVIVVIIFLRKTPKTTETFYLDEIKAIKPANADLSSPPRNGTSKNSTEPKRSKAFTPVLSVQTSEVFTSVGQPTVILCETSGTPAPDVTWNRDGRFLCPPDYLTLADGSLYIVDTDLKDDGNYIVAAFNDAGTVEESVKVGVIAPIPPESDSAHPPQTISEFTERMALLHSTADDQLEEEYHDIELEWNITIYNAKLLINHNKNRYVNIIPYDHSRVVLSLQDRLPGTDYINASYIDGYNETNSYIATQGPIPSTFADFWRMMWEFDVPTIVMVTNLKEDEKIKCHQYWPSYGSSSYGDLQVSLKEVENIVDYSIRKFQIQPLNGSTPAKDIRQFHFQVWPDHGVPQYATALLGFRKRIRKHHPSSRGPMVVHCSAGVGRTGTFICIDSMMRMVEAEGKIDIFNFVRNMRFRRNYMVQTSTQYEFIHEALLEAIMCGDTSIPVKNLNEKIQQLKELDGVSGKTGFLTQFEMLESSCPSDEDFDCSVAQLPDNLAKTRTSKHLPPNDNRVVLSTQKYDSDYICASFVDGYRQRQCFITTQGPMKNTAGDFWRMIWEYNCNAIVMLTQLEEHGVEQCVKYWPSSAEEPEICGSFQVEVAQEERVLPEYIVRKFNLCHIDNKQEVRTIVQFHYTEWSSDSCPISGTFLNDMIGEVLRVQRKSGNGPIAVHCNDGLGRTGTFCSAFTVLERVKAEQVVDVFSTIKSLRIQRPGLLQSLDQYEFIHKVVVEFLTTFDNYDNFK